MIIGIFNHFFAIETTLAERQFFRALARLISTRAARLSACGIAALVRQMDCLDEGCSVGADGSLYNVCDTLRLIVDNWLTIFIFICRNIPSSMSVYRRDWWMSSVTRESEYSVFS